MGHCFLRCAKRSRTENSPLSSHSFLPPPPLHQTGCAPQSSLVLPRHQNTGKPPVAALLRRRLRLRTTPLPVWHQKPMQVGRQVRRCSGGGGGEQCLISFLSLLLLLFPFSYLKILCVVCGRKGGRREGRAICRVLAVDWGGNLRKCGVILRNGNTVMYFTDLRTSSGRYS